MINIAKKVKINKLGLLNLDLRKSNVFNLFYRILSFDLQTTPIMQRDGKTARMASTLENTDYDLLL